MKEEAATAKSNGDRNSKTCTELTPTVRQSDKSYTLQHIHGVTLPRAEVADSVRQIMR